MAPRNKKSVKSGRGSMKQKNHSKRQDQPNIKTKKEPRCSNSLLIIGSIACIIISIILFGFVDKGTTPSAPTLITFDRKKAKNVPLKVHSHLAHMDGEDGKYDDNDFNPRNVLVSDGTAYCSKPPRVSDDWIIFEIDEEKDTLYYPLKIQIAVHHYDSAVRHFAVSIGSSSSNQWIPLNPEPFEAKMIDDLQSFKLNTTVNASVLDTIREKKWNQFKLDMIDNWGWTEHNLIKRFKLYGITGF